MAELSIIVAVDQNGAIGKENNLLCYLPNDLKYFKNTTKGHPVIMGRKTFDSLPNGALPYRRNIVISRNQNEIDGCEVFNSINNAVLACNSDGEVFVMGGASIYKEMFGLVNKLYVTHIHHAFDDADTYFPTIENSVWREVSRIKNLPDDKNLYAHDFVVYERISE